MFRESYGRVRGTENIQGGFRANFLILERNRGDQSYGRDENVLYVGTHFPELKAHAYQST